MVQLSVRTSVRAGVFIPQRIT